MAAIESVAKWSAGFQRAGSVKNGLGGRFGSRLGRLKRCAVREAGCKAGFLRLRGPQLACRAGVRGAQGGQACAMAAWGGRRQGLQNMLAGWRLSGWAVVWVAVCSLALLSSFFFLMRTIRLLPVARWGVCGALLLLAAVAQAQLRSENQRMTLMEPQNVFQLSAQGSVEVRQDLLMLTLSADREGASAAQVQASLREALDAALAEVKKTAEPRLMDVQTGEFSVIPRYDRNNKINGWQGRASVLLQGRDFPRITAAAARAGAMTVSHVDFSLSREQRAQAQTEAQKQAIEAFRARAAEITRAFGFAGYTLREVSVGNENDEFELRAYAAAPESASLLGKKAAVAVEPGTSTVRVTVSGSVQAQ